MNTLRSIELKRYVIIGGGLSGLYCGVLLTRKGRKVTLLEQHITVGGLAAGFTRKGYYFDSGMERFAADNLKGYFDELGLFNKLDFRRHAAALNIQGQMYTPSDAKEYFDACIDAFPEYRDGLTRFYLDHVKAGAAFMDVNAVTAALSYMGVNKTRKILSMFLRLIKHKAIGGMWKMMRGATIDVEGLLAGYIDRDSKAFAMLTGSRNLDVFQKGGKCSLMNFIGAVCSNYRLNKYPYRGMQSMCDELSRMYTGLQGELITDARVTKILVESGHATGVEYLNGGKITRVDADIVINAADLKKAYQELLDKEQSDSAVLDKLSKSVSTRPIPILYLGVRLDPDLLKQRFAGREELYYYPTLPKATETCPEKDFYKVAPMVVHASVLTNPDHAPKGCTNIQIYLPCPPEGWMYDWGIVEGKKTESYRQLKQAVITDVLSNLEKLIPELADRSLIDVCELGTPHTIERYTGNSGGAHCGFSWDASVNGFNGRMGKFNYRHEKIENLYFIGHWTGFMGGITNAFWSARNLVKKL
jgi:all-trans-retinol 13,14-reductase